jgi:hypothetical protein
MVLIAYIICSNVEIYSLLDLSVYFKYDVTYSKYMFQLLCEWALHATCNELC